jgi:hypothetical protein
MSETREVLTIYDISRDEHRPATQADIDELQKYVLSFSTPPERDAEPVNEKLDFRLACYVNRMRADSVFIAEEKEIEPYSGITNIDGSLCYPSIPKTRYCLPMGVSPDFAREIVRRWNLHVD